MPANYFGVILRTNFGLSIHSLCLDLAGHPSYVTVVTVSYMGLCQTVNHGLSRQFIQMEQSGLNAEPNQKGLISGELHHPSTKKTRVKIIYICLYSLTKTLTLVVSNQKLSTLIYVHCTRARFFPLRFSSASHAESSFVGASDVGPYSSL